MERLYLDHNACSPLRPAVRAALAALLERPVLNAGSTHREGQAARAALDAARRTVQARLNLVGGQWVWTSGATEANNQALQTLCARGPVVACRTAHASVVAPLERAAASGAHIRWVPADRTGRIALDAVAAALTGGARSVVVLHTHNETGVRELTPELEALCAAHGAHLHVDAAQCVFRWAWVPRPAVSSVTVSAHKAGGPVGVGALWWRAPEGPDALLVGGAQERGLRAGTEPVWLVQGVAALAKVDEGDTWRGLAQVRDAFEAALVERVGARVIGEPKDRAPNTCCLVVPGRESEAMLMALDLEGIAASAGSACTAGAIEVSPALLAMGYSAREAGGALRFSFGPEHLGLDGTRLALRVASVLR